jgi:hypothetical protein
MAELATQMRQSEDPTEGVPAGDVAAPEVGDIGQMLSCAALHDWR